MSRRKDSLSRSVTQRMDELKAELAKLEKEKNALEDLPQTHQLAIELHKNLCKWNHTDGCGWHYYSDFEKSTWETEYAHKEWLERAQKLSDFCEEQDISIECAMELIALIKGWS